MLTNISCDIVCNMNYRFVLDANVLVTALCNRDGASHLLIRWALADKISLLASPPLWLEYEAVLKRPEIRLRHGISIENLEIVLDTLAAHVEPVHLSYLWRPQLRDPNDEMVLETALNAAADALVTFNTKDFVDAASRFSLKLITPAECIKLTGDIS
ncbi:putative toxin-antitoxin system toxin component, PIN family [Pelotalea chapellei]|uniref:Toxin-antitoxin system toxin component, PIN family n=1 Tax=Pelotalea chapellei TaxID=44671 RepID=A0ABS5U8N3_9BACT|nr:putative toxin-antitoxin system toxin component, PIN family [Pelotalea chapellei]MBT1072030.1 putative toxin-antitoxin system toxin component, PIN family [Pelotalea chapellei]